jgi:hypothetical protein
MASMEGRKLDSGLSTFASRSAIGRLGEESVMVVETCARYCGLMEAFVREFIAAHARNAV